MGCARFRTVVAAVILVSLALICTETSGAVTRSRQVQAHECPPNPQTQPAVLMRAFLIADVERLDLRHGYGLLWPGSSVRSISCRAFLTGTNEVQPFPAIDWRRTRASLVDRRPRSRLFSVALVSRRRSWFPALFLLELTQRGRYWRVSYWAAAPMFAVPA
jgi:hypothetical protein